MTSKKPSADKANQDIRQTAIDKGIKHWQIADKLGIREETFSKMLRKELPEDMKQKVMEVIDKMTEREGTWHAGD